MSKRYLPILAACLALFLASCGFGPKIDASTPETLKTTTDALRASIPEKEQPAFDRALMVIIASALDPSEIITQFQNRTLTKDTIFNKVAPVLDEKTHQGILKQAEKDREALRAKVVAWEKDRAQLTQRQARYQEISNQFAGITAVDATLEPVDSQLGIVLPPNQNLVRVHMKLQNGMDFPIQKMRVYVELSPEGVQNPWVRQLVEKTFEPAVLPGQVVEMTSPPMNIEVPQNYTGSLSMSAQVEVSQLVAKGGKPTITLPQWTQGDLLQLTRLEVATDELAKLKLL